MPATDHPQVKLVFGEALEREGAERSAYLATVCRDDPALRQRVEALLAAASESQFLGDVTVDPLVPGPRSEGPGTRIGPYKILQLIGEGGFGSVFMAEQEHPVRRRVALKIIKLGMDTRAVVARFEQERQALALMDHPHIAKVFDAGATDKGRPYFVMELVKGEPITQFCDQNSLTIRERLELFIQVCQAVQHAHTKGIIHRDIKPSNVLVSLQDNGPLARIIDFGIAKATDHRLTEKTVFTELCQPVGTPEYMSPEQAEGSFDIDTRTDLYSLGVILYELLTGATPFDPKRLRSAAFGEMQRIIREVDPPRPSTRLSQLPETLPHVAAHRRIEPRRLGTLLRGELDWIVMRALEKDRARRYETASALAADVQRHLAGQPVEARPNSGWYLFRKQVRRNRVPAVVAAAFLVLVTGAAVTTGILYRQAAEALALAEQRRGQAETQAAKAHRVQQFLEGMLRATDPWLGSSETSLISMVSSARATLATELADQPEVRASLQETIGLVYLHIGQDDKAAEEIESALATRERLFGRRHLQTASSLDSLALLRSAQRRHAEAEAIAHEALALYDGLPGAGEQAVARCLGTLSRIARTRIDYPAAERFDRRALALLSARYPENNLGVVVAMANLAATLLNTGGEDEGTALYARAIALCRGYFRAGSPYLASMLNDLGQHHNVRRQFDQSEPLLRESLELRRSIYKGPDLRCAQTLNALGSLLLNTGRYAEAEPLLRESIQMHQQLRGAHTDTIGGELFNLGMTVKNLGRLDEAQTLYDRCMEIARATADEPLVARLLNNLAALHKARGDPETSETYDRQALELRRRLFGNDHLDVAQSLMNLAGTLRSRHDPRAEDLYREAVAIQRRHLDKDDPLRAIALKGLGAAILERDRTGLEAEPPLTEALDILVRAKAPDDPGLVGVRFFLAHSLLAQRRFRETETQLAECQRCLDAGVDVDLDPARIARLFIQLYGLWDKPELQDQWRRKLDAMPARGDRLSLAPGPISTRTQSTGALAIQVSIQSRTPAPMVDNRPPVAAARPLSFRGEPAWAHENL